MLLSCSVTRMLACLPRTTLTLRVYFWVFGDHEVSSLCGVPGAKCIAGGKECIIGGGVDVRG
jgi:hypothetical protein